MKSPERSPVAEPVAQPRDLRVRIVPLRERVGRDPGCSCVDELADLAFLNTPVSFLVDAAVALLEPNEDILFRIGVPARFDNPEAALGIHAHRLLAIDVLLGLNGRLQHPRMLKRRRRDDHRVDVGCQQLLEALINLRIADLDLLLPGFDPVVKQVAERRDAPARVRVKNRGVIAAPAADANEPDRHGRVRLRSANGLRCNDTERRRSAAPQ